MVSPIRLDFSRLRGASIKEVFCTWIRGLPLNPLMCTPRLKEAKILTNYTFIIFYPKNKTYFGYLYFPRKEKKLMKIKCSSNQQNKGGTYLTSGLTSFMPRASKSASLLSKNPSGRLPFTCLISASVVLTDVCLLSVEAWLTFDSVALLSWKWPFAFSKSNVWFLAETPGFLPKSESAKCSERKNVNEAKVS